MELEEKVEQIKSKEDLADFVAMLRQDLINNPEDWENRDLADFLQALESWVLSMDNLYKNLGREKVRQPSWQTVGEILFAASMYE